MPINYDVEYPKLQRTVSELREEVEQLHSTLDALKDPNEVHALMLKGAIATISWRQHCHLTGDVPNTSDHHLSELVKAREEAERLRDRLDSYPAIFLAILRQSAEEKGNE